MAPRRSPGQNASMSAAREASPVNKVNYEKLYDECQEELKTALLENSSLEFTVLYPPRVIPCGIHGMGGGFHGMGDGFHGMVDGFHTFGGWIPWNGGWIPYLFQVDSIPFPDGFHTFSRWIPYFFQMDSILLPYGIQVE